MLQSHAVSIWVLWHWRASVRKSGRFNRPKRMLGQASFLATLSLKDWDILTVKRGSIQAVKLFWDNNSEVSRSYSPEAIYRRLSVAWHRIKFCHVNSVFFAYLVMHRISICVGAYKWNMCTLLVHTHKYSQMIHQVCVMCRALIWSVKTTQIHDISKFRIRSLRICALDTSARVPTVHSSCIQGSTLGFNGSQWIHWAPRAAKNCGLEPRIFRQDFMFCFFTLE